MGIEPHRWGPHVWATIHLCCIGAPDVLDHMQQAQYRAFIMSLPYVIPCTSCSDHFKKVLESIPVDDMLTGKDDLFRWSVNVHNNVNARLKKPIVSYEEALSHWKTICEAGDGGGTPGMAGATGKTYFGNLCIWHLIAVIVLLYVLMVCYIQR